MKTIAASALWMIANTVFDSKIEAVRAVKPSAAVALWQLCNHLDLKLNPIQPRHPDARQRGVGRFAPELGKR
jgi:hypothetical protein